ncbi:2OG-Fe(II) oxygenase [Lacihabitans sp. LS3-19]|uniref:2OG-Fe(II) oxygenase n=1 Tax=Lacihabitans sp. LS3-19 TaxID=2487335 RepID=UPI0020CE7B1F|nr:2OG-Fe(II) oxygenase [Lacihabitans sp. LS3-19]MCP9768086.1 2OG-Fe(II) oxygenase [Lacihabitans sp. LS3-19]
MEQIFDDLIELYLREKVGISENFLTKQLSSDLRDNLLRLSEENKLKDAQIGSGDDKVQNSLIRKDKIFWLDRAHSNAAENAFLDLMDSFVVFLNTTCFAGIKSYEFHYALYEKGSFYKKHLDQFKENGNRQFTSIFYLNEVWKQGDGGELRVYLQDTCKDISPLQGKMVFFKSSELEHEVLQTQIQRMSITGWLKND